VHNGWGCNYNIEQREVITSCNSHETQQEIDDILHSGEAQGYGLPYKLQIWSDEGTMKPGEKGMGEVEVLAVTADSVSVKPQNLAETISMRKSDFIRWFAFKRTTF
jgi:hypothetical protein